MQRRSTTEAQVDLLALPAELHGLSDRQLRVVVADRVLDATPAELAAMATLLWGPSLPSLAAGFVDPDLEEVGHHLEVIPGQASGELAHPRVGRGLRLVRGAE